MACLLLFQCIKERALRPTLEEPSFGTCIFVFLLDSRVNRNSCYQLFITIGILLANLINFGTESISNTGSWRIPLGIGFLWPIILGLGILCFPESPRFDFRHGKVEEARNSIAAFYGVGNSHKVVNDTISELGIKLKEEEVGAEDRKWHEVFTGPRMRYRILLGMSIQMFQQLTGMNYFM